IIGHNTYIGQQVSISTSNNNFCGKVMPFDNTTIDKPVIIGSNVFIGKNVTIIPGIRIGDGAVITMGTLVNRDIKPSEVVGPAEPVTIKMRDPNHYKNLIDAEAFRGYCGKLIDKSSLKNYNKTYAEQRYKRI